MIGNYTVTNLSTKITAKHFTHLTNLKNTMNLTNTTTDVPPIAGVNMLLVGVLVGCVMIMAACICYLWHSNLYNSDEPSSVRYNTRADSWIHLYQIDTPVHIFTLENQEIGGVMDFEIPPPSYDEVVKSGDADLPSYETAVNLSARGYV